jgi:ferredoxin-thioredoxin reductase catalytic subunit
MDAAAERLKTKLAGCEERGYYLNPDISFTDALVESLMTNQERYGYQACPCRLASGDRSKDLDIICPCYYRDADVADFGTCYCGLYVSREIFETKGSISSIPERRRPEKERLAMEAKEENKGLSDYELDYPVWRCEVCGYICARDEAPEPCPICGASRDRFARFI